MYKYIPKWITNFFLIAKGLRSHVICIFTKL